MEDEEYQEKIKQKIEKFKSKDQIQKILDYLKQGMTCDQIADMPDIKLKRTTIELHRKKCVEYNLITEDEIKEARLQRKIEELKQDEQIRKILEYKKQNLSSREISRMPDITYSQRTIINYINKCIEYGIIVETEKDDEEIAKMNEKSKKAKETFEQNEQVQRVLKYLKQGRSCNEISEMEDITVARITVFAWRRKAIDYGLIDEKEIERRVEERKIEEFMTNEQVRKILAYKKQNLSNREISCMPDITVSKQTIANYINTCIQYNLITIEEIEEKRKQEREEIARKKREESEKRKIDKREKFKSNEQVQKIITYKKQGLSDKKIVSMPDITVSAPTVASYITKSIEYGLVTKEEIEEVKIKKQEEKMRIQEEREKRQQEEKMKKRQEKEEMKKQQEEEKRRIQQEEKRKRKQEREEIAIRKKKEENEKRIINKREKFKSNEQVQKILTYKKQGLSDRKIVNMPDITVSAPTVAKYIAKSIEYELITKEEIENAEIRKQEEKRKRLEEEKKRKQEERKRLEEEKKRKQEEERKRQEEERKRKQEEERKRQEEERKRKQEEERKRQEEERKRQEEERKRQEEERRQQEEKRNKEETKEKKLRRLKREIDVDIKIDRIPSKQKKEKIREYIEVFYEINKNQPISKSDLIFLKNAMQKIDSNYKDIVRYIKNCITLNEYKEAVEFYNMILGKGMIFSSEETKKLNAIKNILKKAYAVQRVQFAMSKGNNNTVTLAEVTGLSNEEINFLKIKLSKTKTKISGIKRREEILKMLLKGHDSDKIKENLGISELEMEDIKDQIEYRRINPKERDAQAQIKQDSTIRIVTLFTKLGQSVEKIAMTLKMEPDKVKEDIELALQTNLIKENQLNGIDILKSPRLNLEQLEL